MDGNDPNVEQARLELEAKRLELEELRRKNRAVNRFATPLTPTLLGLVAAGAGGWFQLNANRDLERDKFEYQILTKATEQPTDAARRSFLRFVVDLGLIERRSGNVRTWLQRNDPVPRTVTESPGGPPAGRSIALTPDVLRQIMPTLPTEKAQEYALALTAAMAVNGITTPKRAAAFLATVAYETNELKVMEERWTDSPAQRRYDPPDPYAQALGNTQPGDGRRFRGRGLVMFGGRKNYAAIGQGIGQDLVAQPELAAQPTIAAQAGAYWWKVNGMNERAEKDDFRAIVHRITGGYAGIGPRSAYYANALRALEGR